MHEYFANLAAISAALTWSMTIILATNVSRRIGGVVFSSFKILGAFLFLLILIAFGVGDFSSISNAQIWLLLLSGFVGFGLSDSALFMCVRNIGPRRASVLFACHGPMTVILGMVMLGETLNIAEAIGVVLTFVGCVFAIMWGTNSSKNNTLESIRGALWWSVFLGLLAALGQAIGSIISKPIIDADIDAVTVLFLRMVGGAIVSFVLLGGKAYRDKSFAMASWLDVGRAMWFGVLANGIGVFLLLMAFKYGDAGISALLSSTVPIFVLPILWLASKERPAIMAWFGAALAVFGGGLIIIY